MAVAHVEDRWWKGPRGKRVRTARYGQGLRWRAVWVPVGQSQPKKKAFSTKDAAEDHLREIANDASAGLIPTTATVKEWGQQWMAQQIHQRPKTRELMESHWRLRVDPVIGHLQLRAVTRQHIQEMVASWLTGAPDADPPRKAIAPTTIQVAYAWVGAAFRTAARDHLIRESPCVGVRMPEIVRDRVVPATAAQVHTVAEKVHGRYRAAVLLDAATGMRAGELRGLTIDRIRIDRQLATVKPTWGPPKSKKSNRSITLDPTTTAELRRHLAEFGHHPSGLIFMDHRGQPIARQEMGRIWRPAVEGLGMRARSGWHDLRHFHASMLIAAGMSVTDVADRLGHEDPAETLRTYAHLWATHEDRVWAAVEEGLWAVPHGKPPHAPQLKIVAGQGG